MRLLLLASRFGPDPVDAQALEDAVRAIDDWPAFLVLVERHRLVALVYRSLKGCPGVEAGWLRKLHTRVEANTFQALLQVRELVRIGDRLKQQGVGFLVFKGPVLAVQAYGDIGLRHAGDLDLVVSPDVVQEVETLLFDLGYRRSYPEFELSPRQWRVCLDKLADFVYVHSEHGLTLELHWRFFGNSLLFPLDAGQALAAGRTLLVAGVEAVAMEPAELLLLLCAHGAKHGWFRLFWLLDVHVLLQRLSAQDRWRLLARARELGVDRMFLQGVLLAHRLYGSGVSEELLSAAKGDRQVVRLTRVALEAIEAPVDWWTGSRTLGRVLAMQGYSGRLRKGWRYRWQVFGKGFLRLEDWQRFPLPDALFFLYWPLRPVLRYWPRGPGKR